MPILSWVWMISRQWALGVCSARDPVHLLRPTSLRLHRFHIHNLGKRPNVETEPRAKRQCLRALWEPRNPIDGSLNWIEPSVSCCLGFLVRHPSRDRSWHRPALQCPGGVSFDTGSGFQGRCANVHDLLGLNPFLLALIFWWR